MDYFRVSNLRKRYGNDEVIAGVDLELKRGECFGLLGPNGAAGHRKPEQNSYLKVVQRILTYQYSCLVNEEI